MIKTFDAFINESINPDSDIKDYIQKIKSATTKEDLDSISRKAVNSPGISKEEYGEIVAQVVIRRMELGL